LKNPQAREFENGKASESDASTAHRKFPVLRKIEMLSRCEDHTYRELVKRLPRRKARVKSSQGEGIVIDVQVLSSCIYQDR
jgi:cell fate regulator YaaT (PSP1 superfamily)